MFENSAEEGACAKEVASNVGSRKLRNLVVCGYMFKQILGCLDGVDVTCRVLVGESEGKRVLREPACRPILANMKLHSKKMEMKGCRLY